jgi:transposase
MHVEHQSGAIQELLNKFPAGTPVALESIGNWYWIVDEIETAGCKPLMAHAAKAKVMLGNVNKTDKLDARGLATLLRNGTLPTGWIAPAEIRDERELPRTRMALCKIRVPLKNRIHATLAKYNRSIESEEGGSDIFTKGFSSKLEQKPKTLPVETQKCVHQVMELLDELQAQISIMEERIRERIPITPTIELLKSLPGVGDILSIVINLEIGSIERFSTAEQLASYAGTVPTIKSSGTRFRYGHLPKQSNHYLKWAFTEAANAASRYRNNPRWRHKHVIRLYERIRQQKGHSIAVGAVARHLAEATFWMLAKSQTYREPAMKKVLPKQE